MSDIKIYLYINNKYFYFIIETQHKHKDSIIHIYKYYVTKKTLLRINISFL